MRGSSTVAITTSVSPNSSCTISRYSDVTTESAYLSVLYFNSLHAEMVCTLPFINAEINVIGLRSKWQALPSTALGSASGLICIDSV